HLNQGQLAVPGPVLVLNGQGKGSKGRRGVTHTHRDLYSPILLPPRVCHSFLPCCVYDKALVYTRLNPCALFVWVCVWSEQALLPITNEYGQMVIKQYDHEGNYTGAMSHVLRAFLIDRHQNIRQEYSVSFLHDQLVAADIKTLLIEDGILTADAME
ncbi:MAG: hypothetical protein AAF304_10455, partial [Pseudomonadota bacterium]